MHFIENGKTDNWAELAQVSSSAIRYIYSLQNVPCFSNFSTLICVITGVMA